MPEGTGAVPVQASRTDRFISNVIWSWVGVGVNLAVGIFLSPYIIRKLGPEGYGIWALLFSVVGHYGLLDLGLRSAVVRYSARFHAKGEIGKINELLNTAIVYFAAIGLVLFLITLYLSRYGYRFLKVGPDYQHDFSLLVLLVGSAFAFSLVFDTFGASLEGFQRFDMSNRIYVAATLARAIGCFGMLALGYGLFEIGLVVLFSLLLNWALTLWAVRRAVPGFRLSLIFAKVSMLKEMASYGLHTLVANIGATLLTFAYPVLIGHYLPVAFVGYYSLPVRLLQYSGEVVGKAGLVTAANAAELQAQGHLHSVSRLGIFTNRYCFTLYMPVAIVLAFYGHDVLRIWVGAAFAAYSAPVLPILLFGAMIANIGQFNSSTILFGLAKHQRYALGLLLEAIASIVLGIIIIPRYGILGAAWVSACLMIAVRGLYTPWLVCRHLNYSFASYLFSIFWRPLATALPVCALVYWLKLRLLPGSNLKQLALVAVVVSLAYFSAAFFTCFEPEHRTLVLARVGKTLSLRLGLATKS